MGEMSGPISDTVYKGLFTFQDAFVYIRSYLLATDCLFISKYIFNQFEGSTTLAPRIMERFVFTSPFSMGCSLGFIKFVEQ